jgi:glutathione reductase (NADPH)
MIEPDLLGGTCPNRGCCRKKCWSQRARRDRARQGAPQRTGSASSIKRADRNAQSRPSGWSTERDESRKVDGHDLAAGKVQSERRRIALDAYLRSTSNPAVYVCGDAVAETAQLSPIATYEGRVVGRNIVDGAKHTPDYASIPACVFTVPGLASVGLTQADRRGEEARVSSCGQRHARVALEPHLRGESGLGEGGDRQGDGRLIGAHLVGHAGEELIHIFALAIEHGVTAGDLGDLVYGFPTFSADIKSMM